MQIQGNIKYIVFGAGKSAFGMNKYINQFYDLLGYYDSNRALWGQSFCGKIIFDKAQELELCAKYQDDL